jgi:hypothetical protein
MAGMGGHYIEGNKLGTERWVLHDLSQVWNLKMLISYKLRVEWWFPEPGESRGEGGM